MQSEKVLIERYGPWLTVDELAEVLHREPQSVRSSLRREGHPLSALANVCKKRGPRMYFRADDVALFMDGEPE